MTQDPIVIVGAGPVGLTAAHRIAHHGVPVRIIDALDEPSRVSKALILWRRTLQVLDSTIDYEKFLAAGTQAKSMCFFSNKSMLGRLKFDVGDHALPAGVFIPQFHTEAILTEVLRGQGVEVERSTRLTGLTQDEHGVNCELEGPNGTETLRCSWLIGCDGAHSSVRKLLKVPFPGQSGNIRWVLSDITVDGETSPFEAINAFGSAGMIALFPVEGSCWRIIVEADSIAPGISAEEVTDQQLQSIMNERTSLGWKLVDTVWRGSFHTEERQVGQYVHGRVLLSGDAAHVHSPIGGQGMNTGMQDSVNLAWKIALAYHGADRSLVQSYHAERHPVGREVIQRTSRLLRGVSLGGSFGQFLRDLGLRIVLNVPPLSKRWAEFLNEESVQIRGSSLCGPGIAEAKVQPGDAFPDIWIETSEGLVPSTHLLRGAEATLIAFGDFDISGCPTQLTAGQGKLLLNVVQMGGGSRGGIKAPHLSEIFGISDRGVVLVRPDGIVWSVGQDLSVVPIELGAH